jgi:hypothetical protein
MRLSSTLLPGIIFAFTSAEIKLTDVFEVDGSCGDSKPERLEAAFQDVVKLVTIARLDLLRVQRPQPQTKAAKANWNRVARNLAGIFGIQPPDDKEKQGYDSREVHFKTVEGKSMPKHYFSLHELTQYRRHLRPDV